MVDNIIETFLLEKIFEDNIVVAKLDLQIPKGIIWGFLGPNGAGKTTTIRMLSALIKPSSGKALVNGYELGKNDMEIRKSIGLLTETPGFYETLTAWQNLLFFGKLYDIPLKTIKERAEYYLKLLSLWDRKDHVIALFSKGMKQRLAIIRALIHEPEIVFLDEPSSGLDPESARTLRELISMLRRNGKTVILTTHNLTEADMLCDIIAIFKNKLLIVDSPIKLREAFFEKKLKITLSNTALLYEKYLLELAFIRNYDIKENTIILSLSEPEANNTFLIEHLIKNNTPILYVEKVEKSLEEVYLELISSLKN